MRRILAPVAVVLFFAVFALVHAQEGGGAGAGTAATRLGVRAAADPASVERGATTYASSCGFCHGGDARGAQGPDLTRSLYVLTDEDGKILGDFLKVGRPEAGMPAVPGTARSRSSRTWPRSSRCGRRRGAAVPR